VHILLRNEACSAVEGGSWQESACVIKASRAGQAPQRCAIAQSCIGMGDAFCLLYVCPAARTRVRMVSARRLAPCILAKVMLWWLSSAAQRRRNNASAVQCVSQSSIPLSANSLHQRVQHRPQHPNLCTVMSCGPSVRVVRMLFLLQEVIGALDTAPAGRNSITNS